jgi:hypothetical protein
MKLLSPGPNYPVSNISVFLISVDIPTTRCQRQWLKCKRYGKARKEGAETDTIQTASTSCTITNVLMGLSHEIYVACDGMCKKNVSSSVQRSNRL